jgi:hypothetical protein
MSAIDLARPARTGGRASAAEGEAARHWRTGVSIRTPGTRSYSTFTTATPCGTKPSATKSFCAFVSDIQ